MNISIIIATLVTGISVFIVLSYLLIPQRITFPISIFMSSLLFGLARYYCISDVNNVRGPYATNDPSISPKSIDADRTKLDDGRYTSNFIFILVFLASLVICLVFSRPDLEHIYKSWYAIGIIDLITLGAGIILSFFLPGYAILLILSKRHKVNPVLKVLISYLFSMLITGLTIYLSEIFFEYDPSEIKTLLIGVYAAILALFVISYGKKIVFANSNKNKHARYQIISDIYGKSLNILRTNLSEVIVFCSLFALLIVSTNYLYGGITIGDQWYHQNRALYFLSGQFKEYVLTDGDYVYPPLQSALLAGVTMLSGIPLVNTYASLAFLNMTAVFAFYYFCSSWFPNGSKRAALLASSLFLISSGFGWIYVITLTDTNPIASQISSISNFLDDKIKFTDIIRPSNFMIAAHPDFSTALIYITLPAGFVLLGLIRANVTSKLCYTITLSLVSILGILSHDEFYLFIIVSSTLPLIYNMPKKHHIYFALLFAHGFTYIIDALLPVRYFTTTDISGFPLIHLSTIFILVMLSLYILRQNLPKGFHFFTTISLKSEKRFSNYTRRINLIPKAILVGVIFYSYVLCLVIWDQLPANLVDMHTQNYDMPWYVYFLRLGVIGLIGLLSILSYAFRRFEKEIFIFGLIIIFALFAGPYYDEQRFSKYVMVGMIGFASLLVFKLLNFTIDKKPILNGIIVSLLVISASLSTLMYIGFNALVIQTGDYTNALGRRNFPSEQEMNVLDMLRSKILFGSNHQNIASYPNEYNPVEGGFMTKLHAFSGLPIPKIPQTRYLLNSSTLDSFYYLIEKSNTGYILIPANSTNQPTLGDSARFAFENFQHRDDHNYLLVNVPSLHGPSTPSDSEVGIVYKKDNSSVTSITDKKMLPFSNYTFDSKGNDTEFIQVNKENQSEKAALYGYKKQDGKTIWSKDFEDRGINYIDSMFRIRGENKTGDDSAGIKWREGSNTYTVSISNRGLELRRQLSSDHSNILLSQNSEIRKNDWVWHSLKVENLPSSINVYVDNLLKMKIPREPLEKAKGIAKVAIYSTKNSVEFEPIQIGKIGTSEEILHRTSNYEYNYPISSLALSESTYSTFAEDDYSVLSKNIIVLPFDPPYRNDTQMNNYLNYVRSGGTLVVINSDGNFVGSFGKLLSIQAGQRNSTQEFTDIVKVNEENALLNVSGFARDVYLGPSNDTSVIAYYRNDQSKLMEPFAIEKHFPNSGRIIYINGEGYFNAIYKNPKKYFDSLAHFSDLFDTYSNNSRLVVPQNVSVPIKQFIGDVDISGKISINGSSLSIVNASTDTDNITASVASILDKNGNLKNYMENLSMISMKPSGQYEVSIDSLGAITIPGSLTQRDYVQISLPDEFNMTLTLFDNNNTHLEILSKINSSMQTIKLNGGSKVAFDKVKSASPQNSVPVVIKNPLIAIDGNLYFEKSNFYGGLSYLPINASGHAEVGFGLVDNFEESNGTRTRIQYLGYLPSLTINGKMNQLGPIFKLPGEIPLDLKKRGLDVPLISILGSLSNITLVVSTSIGTIIIIWFIRKKHLKV